MADTNTKNEESSIARAPQLITPACFNMAGMAMLPTADAPLKNLVAFIQLFHHSPAWIRKIQTQTYFTFPDKS